MVSVDSASWSCKSSAILTVDRKATTSRASQSAHAHPEPMLILSFTATLTGTVESRNWLVPPGHGLWVPGGAQHAGVALHSGVISIITFAAGKSCPIPWMEPTGVAVGPLLTELVMHMSVSAAHDVTRPHAEALMFGLLAPLEKHKMHVELPRDPRLRSITEWLITHPDDQRELSFWASEVHSSTRTLSRLFLAETGSTFTSWRTQLRIGAAIEMLRSGRSVNATARAVGYRKTGAFIEAFRRITGQTPGGVASRGGDDQRV